MWTRERVELWLMNAHDTMVALPDLERRRLYGSPRTSWPDVVHNVFEAYGYTPAEEPRTVPTAAEIDRMEQVLLGVPKPTLGLRNETPWLCWLSHRRRRLVWRRISGKPWWNIAAREHRTERTVQRWYREALEAIADELNTVEGGS